MRVLFLLSGSLWIHTLPEGFSELGHQVKIISITQKGEFSKALWQFQPDFIVSIGWGIEQRKENQPLIRKYVKESKIPHIYWSVEDPAYTSIFSLPLIQMLQPDFVFTICSDSANFYNKLGIKSDHMDFGFAPKIHCPVQCDEKYKSTIAVVANAYPEILIKYPNHYRYHSLKTLICPLLKENMRIDFWGDDWDKIEPIIKYDIPQEWIHGHIPYKEANKVYSSANIVLSLQNYTHQVTQRTYEILASRGFLITSDTLGIRKLFKPGEDLITSSSPAATVSIVQHYLNNPDECSKIAKQGECSVSAYSYKNRAEYMISILKKEKIIAK